MTLPPVRVFNAPNKDTRKRPIWMQAFMASLAAAVLCAARSEPRGRPGARLRAAPTDLGLGRDRQQKTWPHPLHRLDVPRRRPSPSGIVRNILQLSPFAK